jgi:hypothetical protein
MNMTGTSGQNADGYQHAGHAHFWQRALARRQFLRSAAGATGLALGSGLWMPVLARAAPPSSSVLPNPIPGGFVGPGGELYHNFAPPVDPQLGGLPWPQFDLSPITDFNGALGVARIEGTGTLTTSAGTTTGVPFDADMRFVKGLYVGVDGNNHQGTFGFF